MQSVLAAVDRLDAVARDVEVACPVVLAVGRVGLAIGGTASGFLSACETR
jgi:hypothetical protein